ncbi:RNA-directed DNA polymerase, eukaryota, reverse transcriptase zinc-binding domain protein [Tanacetum coccineum]
MDFKIAVWNFRGMSKALKQNEVKNLIYNERLSMCAVLETHLKTKKIKKVCDKEFRQWEWIDIQKAYDTGDPMSPYLFTLVMGIFNLLMIKKNEDSYNFKYHFGCKEIKLTHLCFEDDLIVVCNGDKKSLEVVKDALNDFSMVSGLFPNLSKSTICFGSINERDKGELLNVLPFQCGKLPMKYLEVPLLAKRLGIKDCQSLVDRVASKINCWRNKFLSYVERLQLIASMHVYWASVYILPSGVIRDIEKLLKRFLWNSGDSAQGKARVSWKTVCKPKENGGLGLRSLKEWNETLLLRQLWKIIEGKESLWVKWVNIVKLKQYSLWEVSLNANDSWGWKNMMDLRES